VLSYAEKLGVMFAVEPVAKDVMSTPKLTRKVLDEINSPNLGVIFDPVNLLSIDNFHERENIHKEAIELLGNDIMAVHIKDFVKVDNKLESVAAGDGEMDYRKILSYLKKSKPFIHATLENTNPDNAVKAKEYIERQLAEAN